jgi:hypothetical protein
MYQSETNYKDVGLLVKDENKKEIDMKLKPLKIKLSESKSNQKQYQLALREHWRNDTLYSFI